MRSFFRVTTIWSSSFWYGVFLWQRHSKCDKLMSFFTYFMIRIVTLLLIFMYGKFTNLFCDIVNTANTGWIFSWGLICWSFYTRELVLWNCSKIFCNSMEDPLIRIATLLLIFMYGKFTNLFCEIVTTILTRSTFVSSEKSQNSTSFNIRVHISSLNLHSNIDEYKLKTEKSQWTNGESCGIMSY